MTVQTWIIGQDESCDVRVADEYASGQHCAVRKLDDGRFFVVDLGSTNGTYLEGPTGRMKVIAPTEWVPGMTLIVGRSRIPRPS